MAPKCALTLLCTDAAAYRRCCAAVRCAQRQPPQNIYTTVNTTSCTPLWCILSLSADHVLKQAKQKTQPTCTTSVMKGPTFPELVPATQTHQHGHDYELLLLLHSALLAACAERKPAHSHLRLRASHKVSRLFSITSSRQHQLTTADMLPSDKCLAKLQAGSAALAHPALTPCL